MNGNKRLLISKTIVFCSTVRHAQDLVEEFKKLKCHVAEIVTGETPKEERKQILEDLEHGDVQVVVNVAVLTEGFDAPPVACIVLTRPCSYKSTMVQMIGRGLRTIDPELYPVLLKKTVSYLDFGYIYSSRTALLMIVWILMGQIS